MSIKVSGGGGGGGTSYPGVTGDGQTPGGLVVDGDIQAGTGNAGGRRFQVLHATGSVVIGGSGQDGQGAYANSRIHGCTQFDETPGQVLDGQDTVDITQNKPLTVDHNGSALSIGRLAALNGFDYLYPAVYINDATASAQPALVVDKGGATQLRVDGDGVCIHAKFKTGASIAHTLGSYSGNAVPVYDEAGTLLGYMPLYA